MENAFYKLWKFRNILLFIDYIKFNFLIFYCYIFYFDFFFTFIPKNLIFISTLSFIFIWLLFVFLLLFF